MPNPKKQHNLKRFNPSHPFHPPLINSNSNIYEHDRTTKRSIQTKLEDYYVNLKQNNSSKFNSQEKYTKQSVASFENQQNLDDVVNPYDQLDMDSGQEREMQEEGGGGVYGFEEEQMMGYFMGNQMQQTYIFNDQINISSSSSQPCEYRHQPSDKKNLKKSLKKYKSTNQKKQNKTLPNFLNKIITQFHINIDQFEHSQQNDNIIDIPQQYLINQIPSQDYEYFIDVPDFDINLYFNSQKKQKSNLCDMEGEYVEEISSSSDLYVGEQLSDGVSSQTIVSSSEADSDSQCKQIVTINLEQADSTENKKQQAHEAKKEIKIRNKEIKKSSKKAESNLQQQRKINLKTNSNLKKKQQLNSSVSGLKDDRKNSHIQKAKRSFPKLFFTNLFGQQNQDQPKDIEHPIFRMENIEQTELKAAKKKRKRERKQIELMKNTDILVPCPSPPPQVSDPSILSLNKLLSTISFLRRPKPLQRLIRRVNSHHHSQRSELVSCLFFNNSYFQNIEFNIPHAMKIPLHFRSGQDYQRIFSSHIRNQIYHQTRQKIAQVHKIATPHIDLQPHLQRSSAQHLFNLTITREQKIIRQNLYELTGQIHLQCSNFGATQRLFNQIYQNYKSKYRLLVFVGQDEEHGKNFTVVCQIRKVFWDRDDDKMGVWLVGGVGVEGKKIQGGVYDLGKITTPIRDYEAIQNIKHSPLFTFLLNPAIPTTSTQFQTPQNPTLPTLLATISQNYNQSQQQAIKYISSATSGIHLLQGPPGTGKTHTLLGILSCEYNKLNNINAMIQKIQKIRKQNKIDIRIVNEDSQEDDQIVQTIEKDANVVKILVCTPSNAAVDYIVAKIIQQGLYGLGQSQEWLGLNKLRQQPKLNKNIIDINEPLINYYPENQLKNTEQTNNRIYPRFLRIGLPEPSPSLNSEANMPLPQFENLVRLPQPLAIKILSLLHPYSFNLYQIINQLFQQQFKKKSKHVPVYCIVDKIYKLEEEIKGVRTIIDQVVDAISIYYDLNWDIIINQLFYIIQIKKTLIKALSFFNQPSSPTSTQPTLKHIISKTEHLLVYSSDIILTTLTTSFSQKLLSCNPTFSCLIVDEAAQATQPNILIPMQYGMNKVILVGDHCQLPATVRSVELKRAMFERSLFERVWEGRTWETNVTKNTIRIVEQRDMQDDARQTKILHMLDTQYRMHPDINEFPNKNFYQNRIKSATHSAKHSLKNQLIKKSNIKRGHNVLNNTQNKQGKEKNNQIIKLLFDNVCFIDCRNGKEQKVGSSYVNKLQALIISAIVKQIFTCSIRPEIGIITPYTQQQRYLKSLLPHLSHLTISTVDSYQGQQRDIILISTVRSNSQQNTGFIGDEKRMNVALTRAKYALVIVGNASTLSNSTFWGLYLQWVRRRSNKGGWKQFQGGDIVGWVRKEVVGKEVIQESGSCDRLWAISNKVNQGSKQQEKIAKVLQEQQQSMLENSISIPTSYRRGIKKQIMDEQIELCSQEEEESY